MTVIDPAVRVATISIESSIPSLDAILGFAPFASIVATLAVGATGEQPAAERHSPAAAPELPVAVPVAAGEGPKAKVQSELPGDGLAPDMLPELAHLALHDLPRRAQRGAKDESGEQHPRRLAPPDVPPLAVPDTPPSTVAAAAPAPVPILSAPAANAAPMPTATPIAVAAAPPPSTSAQVLGSNASKPAQPERRGPQQRQQDAVIDLPPAEPAPVRLDLPQTPPALRAAMQVAAQSDTRPEPAARAVRAAASLVPNLGGAFAAALASTSPDAAPRVADIRPDVARQPVDSIDRQLDVARDGEWLDRLARDVAHAAAEDGAALRFRLHPAHLGALRVEIAQDPQGAAVRLSVDSEAARSLLADAQPRLIQEARAQGLRISQTHVDLGGSDLRGSRQQPQPSDAPIRTARVLQEERAHERERDGKPTPARAERYA